MPRRYPGKAQELREGGCARQTFLDKAIVDSQEKGMTDGLTEYLRLQWKGNEVVMVVVVVQKIETTRKARGDRLLQ